MQTTILYQVQMQKLPPAEPQCPDVCVSTPCLPSTRPILSSWAALSSIFPFSFNLIKSISIKIFSSNFDLIKSNTFSYFTCNILLFELTVFCILKLVSSILTYLMPQPCSLFQRIPALHSFRPFQVSEAQCQAPLSSMAGAYCKDTKESSGCWIQGSIESEKRIMSHMWLRLPCPDWDRSLFPPSLYIFGY